MDKHAVVSKSLPFCICTSSDVLPHAHFQILMNVVKAYLDVNRYVQTLLEATTALAQQALFCRQVMIMDVKVST